MFMFDIVVIAIFAWLFVGALKLAFKVTWGLAKVAATVLFVIALPALIGCLMIAGGVLLLVPLGLIAVSFGILKACV